MHDLHRWHVVAKRVVGSVRYNARRRAQDREVGRVQPQAKSVAVRISDNDGCDRSQRRDLFHSHWCCRIEPNAVAGPLAECIQRECRSEVTVLVPRRVRYLLQRIHVYRCIGATSDIAERVRQEPHVITGRTLHRNRHVERVRVVLHRVIREKSLCGCRWRRNCRPYSDGNEHSKQIRVRGHIGKYIRNLAQARDNQEGIERRSYRHDTLYFRDRRHVAQWGLD